MTGRALHDGCEYKGQGAAGQELSTVRIAVHAVAASFDRKALEGMLKAAYGAPVSARSSTREAGRDVDLDVDLDVDFDAPFDP
jgi:hypothetical protein